MKIGIFGRTKADNKIIIKKTEEIGKIIAMTGHTLVTGGTEGYPHVAAISAIKNKGKTISYATGLKIADHLKFHKVDLSTYSKVIFQKNILIKGY